jgi:hypothetical protein
MGLSKGYDVKNPVSRPHRREKHLGEPLIQPSAPGAFANEPGAMESAPWEFVEDFPQEHSLPGDPLAPTVDLIESTAPQTPSVPRSVPT